MELDLDRIRAIIAAPHAYYGDPGAVQRDYRWYPSSLDLTAAQLAPGARVLDIGCGNGEMLLELCPRFASGLGIDTDPEHIALAEAARRERGVANVVFELRSFPRETAELPAESFDLLMSNRGPMPDTPEKIAAALRLLRPDGLLLCEEIAEQHHREVRAVFGEESLNVPPTPVSPRLRDALAAGGLDVRLVQDIFTKWRYPDVYGWLASQCNIWSWLGVPLPAPDDPRIAELARRFASPSGEIEITHHVARVAGVKRSV